MARTISRRLRTAATLPIVLALSLASAAPVLAIDLEVNFQSPPAPVPVGYVRDSGEAYGARSGANQGSGLSYGWVVPGTSTPLDLSVGGSTPGNGRDRNLVADQRLDTLMHMQADDVTGSFNGTAIEGAWEIAVPNGTYDVTVAVGDPAVGSDPERHRINIEGFNVIAHFLPSGAAGAATRSMTATATLPVSDGRLTIDATGGGFNTKINYIDIATSGTTSQPSVTGTTPANGATNVSRDAFVAATVNLPHVGQGIDAATLTAATVQLRKTTDTEDVQVPANLNTSGGGDVIVLQPTVLLDANTPYTFVVTSGLEDVGGSPFIPFSMKFTTGTAGGPGGGGPVSFTKVVGVATGKPFSVLEVGPDDKLYGATLEGEILRWPINGDGTLGAAQTITSIQTANGGQRAIIGLRFDPAATAGNLILWVSHSGAQLTNSPDWLGKVTRLSGPNLATVQDYVVGLPRSIRDHMTNGIDFKAGEPTVLYVMQGSNSAMGEGDNAWGNRPERLLNAAVLRVDLAAITTPPLDVKTEEGGTYDPFAPGAPLAVYGSGTRNCYDLVWHSNGQLYVPCNGSAAGGNTPATPATLPAACATRRMDLATNGAYTGPQVPGITNVTATQNDFLFRVVQGGYYGHPNPQRCEWVLNGGNPTSGTDVAQVTQYPVGTQPDRNWRGAAYTFGNNYSPDGIIEYRSTAFGGSLQGKLLVTRYSGGDDIIALTPGGPNLDIVDAQTGITGMTGFSDPLGIAEHVATGNLYVTELAAGRVTLLRADTPPTGCVTAADCTGALPECGVFACNAGVCSVVPGNTGAVCRSSGGECDPQEICSGASTTCPGDVRSPNGTPCSDDGNQCTNDQCDGTSTLCQHPNKTAGAACGSPSDTDCDNPDTCNGSGACQTNNEVNGTACTSDGNPCTVDQCSGGTCTHPAGNGGTVCRVSTGECDPQETCTGASSTCPGDAKSPSGTACSSDGNICTDDVCNGAGACTHILDPTNDPSCAPTTTTTTSTTTTTTSTTTTTGPTTTTITTTTAPTTTTTTTTTTTAPTTSTTTTTGATTSTTTTTTTTSTTTTTVPTAAADHYLCYRTKATAGTPKFTAIDGVSLNDEIDGSATADVVKPKVLCVPADKNAEGIVDAVTHLESYQTHQTSPSVRTTGIQVTNQVGTLSVDTIKADRLLVPTAKNLTTPPAAPPDLQTIGVNHYKCYKMRVTHGTAKFPKGVTVSVADQFTSPAKTLTLKKPKHFCTPVDKNGEGIKNPAAHLLCYKAKPASGAPKHVRQVGVYLADQFGPLQIDTLKEDELCIPSTAVLP